MKYSSMKEEIENHSIQVYQAKKEDFKLKSKTMLLVSHTLERGGAPLVLLELVPFFRQFFNVIFISINDGDLRDEFLKKGVDIYIGDSVGYAECKSEMWDSFDLVFLNTILSHAFLPLFINRNVCVLWWLHEPEILFRSTYGRIIHFALLSKNIKILSVTDETATCIKAYYGVESPVLHMGLEDRYTGEKLRENSKIRFFIPAKFQKIKGQDIMAQAILDLSPEYQSRAEFIFAGARDNGQPEYYDLISKLSMALESVFMLGEISKDEVYEWYEKVDCVLAPSRADATPTTIVEGMMFNKLCACSTAAGISRYMTNGVNGYVFSSENVNELRELLMYIIDNYEAMSEIRTKGRELYLKHFERNAIEKKLIGLIQ